MTHLPALQVVLKKGADDDVGECNIRIEWCAGVTTRGVRQRKVAEEGKST